MKNLRLKAARAAKDLSQEQLATLCGVSRQTISAIESLGRNPGADTLYLLAVALGTTMDELYRPETEVRA